MVTIGSIVWKVASLGRATEFWTKALGYKPREGGNPAVLYPQHGRGPALLLDEDDRTHLDLWVDGEAEQAAEVERLVSLGAQRVDWVYPEDADFVVLADTEGNLFCVVDTSR